jgi:hypothetical protein
MATISSTIHLSGLKRQTLAALASHAKAEGLSVEGFVKEMIETELSTLELARTKPIDEVFAPVRKQFRESGMSEDELVALIECARDEHRQRTAKKKKR